MNTAVSSEIVEIDQTIGPAFDGDGVDAGEGGRGRVGAVGAVRHEHLAAMRFAFAAEVRRGDEERRELALRPGGRLQADSGQAGDLGEVFLHAEEQFEHALDRVVVLERVQSGEAGERGEAFVPLRVVLHRARTERIKVRVDRHVPRGQVREVANQVDLADFRQRRRSRGEVPGGNQFVQPVRHRDIAGRQAVAASAGAGQIEDRFGRLRIVHGCSREDDPVGNCRKSVGLAANLIRDILPMIPGPPKHIHRFQCASGISELNALG
jgi:hypothetical protein